MSDTGLPRAEPEEVGMASARLRRIAPALQAEVDAGQLPGAVVAVARHGRLVRQEAVGFLGPDRGTPMPPDAVFAIASTPDSKSLTSVRNSCDIAMSASNLRRSAALNSPKT